MIPFTAIVPLHLWHCLFTPPFWLPWCNIGHSSCASGRLLDVRRSSFTFPFWWTACGMVKLCTWCCWAFLTLSISSLPFILLGFRLKATDLGSPSMSFVVFGLYLSLPFAEKGVLKVSFYFPCFCWFPWKYNDVKWISHAYTGSQYVLLKNSIVVLGLW